LCFTLIVPTQKSCSAEQQVSALIVVHHQAKHILYISFLYYTKFPDDNILIRSKHFPPLYTHFYRLSLPTYRQQLNIRGFQNLCCGLHCLRGFSEFISWKNMKCAPNVRIAFVFGLCVFTPYVTSS
jgi:hypothetical protein